MFYSTGSEAVELAKLRLYHLPDKMGVMPPMKDSPFTSPELTDPLAMRFTWFFAPRGAPKLAEVTQILLLRSAPMACTKLPVEMRGPMVGAPVPMPFVTLITCALWHYLQFLCQQM